MTADLQLLFDSTQLYGIAHTAQTALQPQGANKKKILLLCCTDRNLPADEREMLGKMLNALNMNWEDVALLCIVSPVPFHLLKKQITFEKLIAFGHTPSEISLNIAPEKYQVISFAETKIIFSEGLSVILGNKQHVKDRLWKSVKQLFTV